MVEFARVGTAPVAIPATAVPAPTFVVVPAIAVNAAPAIPVVPAAAIPEHRLSIVPAIIVSAADIDAVEIDRPVIDRISAIAVIVGIIRVAWARRIKARAIIVTRNAHADADVNTGFRGCGHSQRRNGNGRACDHRFEIRSHCSILQFVCSAELPDTLAI